MGDVVILTAEDGLADTIRPRLDVAGADVSACGSLQAVRTEATRERPFSLAADVDALEAVVNEHGGALVILDPLDAYLQGVDGHRNSEVRGVLAPLAAMLERTGAAGLLVHHLNKDASTVNALYRAGGSLAFVAAARAVFGVAPDPDSEGRRLFLPVKLNIAAKPRGHRLPRHGRRHRVGRRPGDRRRRDRLRLQAQARRQRQGGRGEGLHPARAGGRSPDRADDHRRGRRVRRHLRVDPAQGEGRSWRRPAQVQSKREGFGAAGTWYWRLAPASARPGPLRREMTIYVSLCLLCGTGRIDPPQKAIEGHRGAKESDGYCLTTNAPPCRPTIDHLSLTPRTWPTWPTP